MKTCGETVTLRWPLLEGMWEKFSMPDETVACQLAHGHDGAHYGVATSGPSGVQWGTGPIPGPYGSDDPTAGPTA